MTGLGDVAEDDEIEPNTGREGLDAGSKGTSRRPGADANSEGTISAGDAAPREEGPVGISAEDSGVPSACSLAGTFAMQVEFDLDWDATRIAGVPTIAAGSGTLSVYSLATVVAKDGQYEAMVRPCGTNIPDFSSAGLFPEQYGVYVDDAAWDQPTMPSWSVSWLLACHDPGCPIQTSVLDAWMGAAPRDPNVRVGPGNRNAVVPVDVDGDRLPGLTVWTKGPEVPSPSGGTYERPLLGLGLRGRASRVMMGIALRAHFGGQLSSCDAMSGESNDGEVGAVAFGCMSKFGAAPEGMCDEQLATVVDQNLPTWRVRSGRYFTTRIAEATCSAVRARFSQPVSP